MQTLNLDHIEIHAGIKEAIKLAKKFVSGFPKERGLYLFGNPGVGKTLLAKAIAESLNTNIVSMPDLIDSLHEEIDISKRLRADAQRCYESCHGACGTSLYGAEGNDVCEVCMGNYSGIVDDFKLRDLLILDDIGTEKVSEWIMERLYLIIGFRCDNDLPLVLTSNLHPDKLAQHFQHDRLVSRIFGMSIPVEMAGEDYRIKGIETNNVRKLTAVKV